jgi:oxygen-independent coproporphyrinogen-3 oxidase
VSLYLHVPVCERLCLYCGCNTTVARTEEPRRADAALLERELERVAAAIGRRAEVSHIHWGGGTPTSLPADCLVKLMILMRSLFKVLPDAEVAIELDPTALAPDQLGFLTDMGVNRVSLGVQDLNPAVQKAIGRPQSYEQTAAMAEALRKLGITSLNLDLIYGLPLQTVDSVAETARRSLDLGADRVAVFGYAHVPWMKRHQALIPEETLPDSTARYAQAQMIAKILEREGQYRPVGLDHFALAGDAMAAAVEEQKLSRGFQGYTTDGAPSLIGLGASAIGCLPQGYAQNAPSAPVYAAAIQAGQFATVRGLALSADDLLRREVIERVMCDLEVDLIDIAEDHAADPAPLLASAQALAQFKSDGLVEWDGRRLVVTAAGRPFLRNVAALFDAYLKRGEGPPRHARAI